MTAHGLQAAAYLRQTGHVNAYTLTKSMTEQLIASFHSAAFPVAIVRPSIVGAIARAPLPGYVGNSAGATAYFMAYATGGLLCVQGRHDWWRALKQVQASRFVFY